MKLNTIDTAFVRLYRGYNIAGGCGFVKARWDLCYMIAMAHPDIELEWHFIEEASLTADLDLLKNLDLLEDVDVLEQFDTSF